MTATTTKRRLAAILAADVVGYSSLMNNDEERTLRILNQCLQVIRESVPRFDGRIFGGAGDSVMIEFASAVEAMRCAMEIQHAFAARNTGVAEDEQMWFRIGISVGDVIVDGDNLMGDSVNIASRLEASADPGGINVSADVYKQVYKKVPGQFRDLGTQSLKNISEPIQVFGVITDARPRTSRSAKPGAFARYRRFLKPRLAAVVLIAVVLLAYPYLRPAPESTNPSIVILPFANKSDSPEQEYFVDGITEDLVTDFSRLSSLTVIAWNTSASYKNRIVAPRDAGRELGVDFVLTGSVRRSGNQLRISAQLVKSTDGSNVWAERYDRDLENVFSLQEEVARKIVQALSIRLTTSEKKQLRYAGTNNFEAYDNFLRGQRYALRRTREGNDMARRAYRAAIELDPGYARAYGALAVTITRDYRSGWTELSPMESRTRALELARKAVALDQSSPQVYWSLGYVQLVWENYEEAAEAANRSVTIAPNYADGFALLALINNTLGEANQAVANIRKAMALNPYYTIQYPGNLGRAYYTLGRYKEAVQILRDAIERNENALSPHLFLAASYVRLGQLDEAKWEIEKIKLLNPEATLAYLGNTFPIKHRQQMNDLLDDLRKAGLPE